MQTITNPILPGFNPDPSIVYANGAYYIATSTFQWFPGVQIHKSTDLVNWELICRPLDRLSQLDMRGVPDNGGIWAPCLSYADGLFWLIYTNVHSIDGIYKDAPNYLVTSESIEGPWSDPIFLNASGFDPSLFHDDDGKKYLVNMVWDHRPWKENSFYGIALQEYSHVKQKLIGKPEVIFKGSPLRLVEGPHLYKKDGYYYLFTAEGGTGYEHAETVARSKQLTGPYEIHPQNPLITAKDYPDLVLQKTGHGDVVQTPHGAWYFVHLTSRPSIMGGFSVLGRETAIQKLDWPKDDWPRLATGGNEPALEMPAPMGITANSSNIAETHGATANTPSTQALATPPNTPQNKPPETLAFLSDQLPKQFQFLRYADEHNYSLNAREGWLRLYGRDSMSSLINQSLLGVRVDNPLFTAETLIDFTPTSFQHTAGLAAYYDTSTYYYLHISFDEQRGRVLHLQSCDKGEFLYSVYNMPLPATGKISLKVCIERASLQFYMAQPEAKTPRETRQWQPVGKQLPTSLISDDYKSDLRFTGAFCALACQDLTGMGTYADFQSLTIQRGEAGY